MSAPVDTEARRLADLLLAQIADAATPPVFLAKVSGLTAGGSGGGQIVQVTRTGTTITANGYLNSYTPSVNDWVLGVYVQNQPILLGKIIGSP